VFERTGGPEVLVSRDLQVPPPGPGEVRVRHTAVGVNYLDVYIRSGLVPLAAPAMRSVWKRRVW
jgi:NADPH2:quinone reductase